MPETQAQYKARILGHVAGREPLPLLTAAPATLAALLAAVPPALCARRPAPGKWSIQEVVAHLADDVRLVVSELATNVGRHTDTPSFSLMIGEDDDGVTLAVTDSSPSFLRSPELSELTDLSGRGLVLTEALCRSWGVTAQADGGKSVWATFTR